VRVVVRFLQAGLMHVSVAVLGSVVVRVGVLVLDVLVLMRGVRMRVSDAAVFVLVRVRPFMGVFVVRHDDPYLLGCVFGWATACSGVSVR
jgi:hypothetical protein